ncbi:MAG: amine oxidase [Ilyomonas sp.]
MNSNPFRSFWMAGYECTDQLNSFGNRVDLLTATGHLQLLSEDYKLLKPFGITTVREGIQWSKVERKPYEYDWSKVDYMMNVAKENSIQQVWDICHFGFPDDLSPLHPHFTKRFTSLCKAFVRHFRSKDADSVLIVTPVNEVSFLSYLGGDVRGTTPYCVRQGWEVKYSLMKAYISAVAAMKEIDPGIRILTTEPLINRAPVTNATPEQIEEAKRFHNSQFESVDMLAGKLCPELGGQPDYLDIIGVNYYYNNQSIVGVWELLPWRNAENYPQFKSLSTLIKEVYKRYGRPIALTETSHPEEDRPLWIEMIGAETKKLLEDNIPLLGICLYPIIDRPDWDQLHPWHKAGLWDEKFVPGSLPERILYEPYAKALKETQNSIKELIPQNTKCQKELIKSLI